MGLHFVLLPEPELAGEILCRCGWDKIIDILVKQLLSLKALRLTLRLCFASLEAEKRMLKGLAHLRRLNEFVLVIETCVHPFPKKCVTLKYREIRDLMEEIQGQTELPSNRFDSSG